MPDFSKDCRDRGPEQPLPQGQARQRRQKKAEPQVRPAQAEAGPEPARGQLQADQQLAQKAPPGRFHPIDPGPQQHPRQKTAQKAAGSNSRGQNRRLRLGRGSS